MTVEEFRKRVEDDSEWAPGWEIIDKEFDRIYPGQTPGHYATDMVSRAIFGGGKSLHTGVESNITALLTISDTEAQTRDTLYGKTEFIQLFGITESELQALIKDHDNAYKLYDMIKRDNPDFVTEMKRTRSYF